MTKDKMIYKTLQLEGKLLRVNKKAEDFKSVISDFDFGTFSLGGFCSVISHCLV